MEYTYEIYEYKYKLKSGLYWCFYARTDETAEKMVELFRQGTEDLGIKLTFKKKTRVWIAEPPYEREQEQFRQLEKGLEKKNKEAMKK